MNIGPVRIFLILAAIIGALTFSLGFSANPLANVVLSVSMGFVASLIICGVLLVDDKPRQIISNSLLATGVLCFLIPPMLPDPGQTGWLIMFALCPILLTLGYRLDQTGRSDERR